MDLERIRRVVQAEQAQLSKLDVDQLWVFGSHARGASRKDSDVDVLVRFTGPASFDRYMELRFLLEERLGLTVDLVTEPALRPELRDRILADAVRVA